MMRIRSLFVALSTLLTAVCGLAQSERSIASQLVDPAVESISMHWKTDSGGVIGNIGSLKEVAESGHRALRFAMNGGMFTKEQAPVGLYIEQGRILQRIDRRPSGYGNFYLQPNGVFGIYSDGTAFLLPTGRMDHMLDVRFATQSGPMLIVDSVINSVLTPGSKNLNIRNGVGLLPDGKVLFAISRVPINFYDFAQWFLEQGCTDALYLDGSISRAFIPEEGMVQVDGKLGVIIAVVADP